MGSIRRPSRSTQGRSMSRSGLQSVLVPGKDQVSTRLALSPHQVLEAARDARPIQEFLELCGRSDRTKFQAVQRVVRSFVDWGVLVETDERGIFAPTPKITVAGNDGVGPWLLEAGISNCERQAHPFRSLVGAASFFPLKLKLSPRDVGSRPRLEVYRQGLDEDVVVLHGFAGKGNEQGSVR